MNRKALVLVGIGALASASLALADSRLPRQQRLGEVQQAAQQIARDAMNLLNAADDRTGPVNGGNRQGALQAIVSFEQSAHELYRTVGAHIRADELLGQRPDPTVVEYAMNQLEIDFQNLYPSLQPFPQFRQQLGPELERVRVTVTRLIELFDPLFEIRLIARDFARDAQQVVTAAEGERVRNCEPRPIQPGPIGARRCGQMQAAIARLSAVAGEAVQASTLLNQRFLDRDAVMQRLDNYDRNAPIAENFMRMADFSQHVMTQQAQARNGAAVLRSELNQVRR